MDALVNHRRSSSRRRRKRKRERKRKRKRKKDSLKREEKKSEHFPPFSFKHRWTLILTTTHSCAFFDPSHTLQTALSHIATNIQTPTHYPLPTTHYPHSYYQFAVILYFKTLTYQYLLSIHLYIYAHIYISTSILTRPSKYTLGNIHSTLLTSIAIQAFGVRRIAT